MRAVLRSSLQGRDRSRLTILTILVLLVATLASSACSRGRRGSPTSPPPIQSSTSNLGVLVETKTNGEDADLPPGPSIAAGKTVTWTYRVRNVGADTLSGIALSDDMRGDISCPSDTLLAGEAMTCRDTDIAVEGQYANVATVTANGDDGTTATDSDPSHYLGTRGSGSGGGGGGGGGSQPPASGGCGPGFWKNNAAKNGGNAWPAAYPPSSTLASAPFVNESGVVMNAYTLQQALGFNGGPTLEDWEKNMLKHAVAALLNAATPNVNYPWSTSQVLGAANQALASNNQQTLNNQKDEFESMNSAGCPLE